MVLPNQAKQHSSLLVTVSLSSSSPGDVTRLPSRVSSATADVRHFVFATSEHKIHASLLIIS
jgi:hypothetical protein